MYVCMYIKMKKTNPRKFNAKSKKRKKEKKENIKM